jgi:hypothetical protein
MNLIVTNYAGPTDVYGAKQVISDTFLCGFDESNLDIKPAWVNTGEFNIFDIGFTLSADTIPATGEIEVHFPTHNGIDEIFATDLGLGMLADEPTREIDCFLAGHSNIKCTVHKAASSNTSTPVVVKINGFTGAVAAAAHVIRLVKIKNPAKASSTLLEQKLYVSIYVVAYSHTYTMGRYKILEGTDHRVFNKNTKDLADVTVTAVSDSTIASLETGVYAVTATAGGKELIFTFTTAPNIADFREVSASFVVFDMPSSFSLTKGATAVTCVADFVGGNTCATNGFPISNWLVVTIGNGVAINANAGGKQIKLAGIRTPSY